MLGVNDAPAESEATNGKRTSVRVMPDRGTRSITGVTLSAPPPIGFVSIPLSSGLNVFYGKNGVGKSQLLDAISELIQRERDPANTPADRDQLPAELAVEVLWDPLADDPPTFDDGTPVEYFFPYNPQVPDRWVPPIKSPSGLVAMAPSLLGHEEDEPQFVDPQDRPDWAQPRLVPALPNRETYRGLEVAGHLSSSIDLGALFGRGGIHIHAPVTTDYAAPDGFDAVVDTAVSWLSDDPWGEVSVRAPNTKTWEKVDAPQYLDELGLNREILKQFFAAGHWFISNGDLYLCDADPFGASPLRDEWERSASLWEEIVAEVLSKRSDTRGARHGALAYVEGSDGRMEWALGGTTPYDTDLYDWEPGALKRELQERVQRIEHDYSHWQSRLEMGWRWETSHVQAVPLLPPHLGWSDNSAAALPSPFLRIGRLGQWSRLPEVSSLHPGTSSGTEDLNRIAIWELRHLPWDETERERLSSPRDKVRQQNLRTGRFHTPTPPLLDEVLTQLSAEISLVMADLFDPAPVIRVRRLQETMKWSDRRSPIVIEANTAHKGAWFPVDELGSGHKHWVRYALRVALNRVTPDWPATSSVLVIDEPELGLHDTTQGRVIRFLANSNDVVVVSSHSSKFIAHADSTGTLFRISQNEGGFVTAIAGRPEATGGEDEAEIWGVSLATLRSLIRTLVFVEGPHDEAVITEVLASELSAAHAAVVPIYGVDDAPSVLAPHLEQITATADTNIVVVLDSSNRQQLQTVLKTVRDLRDAGAQLDRLQKHRAEQRFRRREMATYLALLTAAARNNRLERLHLHGLGEPDIARYLPVQRIAPEFESWESVEAAFLSEVGRTRFESGDGIRFKEFVKRHGGRYHTPGIRAAARDLASSGPLPRDLHALGLLLKSLSDA